MVVLIIWGKMTSVVNDVINWQILGLAEQHQLRFSMISFNQMLPILIAAKSLHGWTIMLSIVIVSVAAVVVTKIQPSLSVRKDIFIKEEDWRGLFLSAFSIITRNPVTVEELIDKTAWMLRSPLCQHDDIGP